MVKSDDKLKALGNLPLHQPVNLNQSKSHPADTKWLAIIIPEFDHGFFNRVAIGAEKAAKANDCMLLVVTTQDFLIKESQLIGQLASRNIDGYLIVPAAQNSTAVKQIQSLNVPLVVIERLVKENVYQIGIDHYQATYQGVEYLIKNGHRKIAYFGWKTSLSNISIREKAFLQAIDDYKIPRNKVVIKTGFNKSPEDSYRLAKELLAHSDLTAIFAAQGYPAKGLIRALHENRISVPEEMSLLVYGEQDWAEFCEPGISCVQLPDTQLGEKGVKLLLQQINQTAPPPQSVSLAGQLLIRGSVRQV